MRSNITYTLDEIAEIYDGPHATPKKLEAGDAIFLSISSIENGRLNLEKSSFISEDDFVKWTRRVTPQAGDVVFSYETKIGEASIIPEGLRCCLGRRMGLLRAKQDKVLPQYLLYAYLSPAFQDVIREKTIHGSTTDRLSIKEMPTFEIELPDIHTQKKIIKILSPIDNKLSKNTEINQTLEQMAQALFKSWFVDFEPVKAKIEVLEAGGSQEDATLAAMTAISGKSVDALAIFEREHPEQYAELKATAELFPSAVQESELGAIPKGWGMASISEMGKVTCGKTPSKKEPEYYGGDVPFIKIPDMHGQLFVLKTNEYLSEVGSKSQLKKLVPANSICVSCIATIGVVSITNEPSHTNQQINSVTPYKSSLLYYLYFCILGLKDHLHVLGSAGSATLNVNTSTFSGIKIAQPDAKVLELFHAKCTHLFNEIKSLSVQTESLAQLRDTLLPKLLSGEITLPEAEELAKEADYV